jgi:hypothetical protein
MEKIEIAISNRLVPELEKEHMLLPVHLYNEQGLKDDFCLMKVPDFNSLIATSQENQTPVFALTREQLGQSGAVSETIQRSQENFGFAFSELADRVINLTCNAVCA